MVSQPFFIFLIFLKKRKIIKQENFRNRVETITLDTWQKEILETEGNICLRSGRQCGKSFIISVLASLYACKNGNKKVMVISAVERQAYLLFEKILDYILKNFKFLVKTGKDRPTKSKIELKNGSVIYCLPTGLSGNNIRGYTIDLLIADEAAFIPDEVFASITPSIATRTSEGARIVLLSTPFGREGYFARAFNDDSFKKFHVSSEECPRIDKGFLEQEKKRMTKKQYTQEYLGEFIDDLLQWFPDSLIKKCMTAKRPEKIDREKRYFLGSDLARMGDDESTFEIGYFQKDKLIQVENQVTKRTLLNESTRHILTLNRAYDFVNIFIDDEGIGVGVFDYLLENEETKRKVIPINNSKRVIDRDGTEVRLLKTDLYNNLLAMMERGEIELLDDPEIFLSLKSVQFDYTTDTKGKPTLKIFGNNTHIAEGLIRLAWAVKFKPKDIWIASF